MWLSQLLAVHASAVPILFIGFVLLRNNLNTTVRKYPRSRIEIHRIEFDLRDLPACSCAHAKLGTSWNKRLKAFCARLSFSGRCSECLQKCLLCKPYSKKRKKRRYSYYAFITPTYKRAERWNNSRKLLFVCVLSDSTSACKNKKECVSYRWSSPHPDIFYVNMILCVHFKNMHTQKKEPEEPVLKKPLS